MLQGSYTIKREGKPPIEFSNVITRKGWQTFIDGDSSIELIKTLKLSRDLELVSAAKEDLKSIFKEVTLDSFSVVLKQEPVWRYESEFRFYLKDLPAGNLGQLGIYSSNGDIFSCANIKNPMGGITHLAIEEGESLEIVYSLTYTLDVKEYKTTLHFGDDFILRYSADRYSNPPNSVVYNPDMNEEESTIKYRFEFSLRFLPYHGEELKNNFNKPLFESYNPFSFYNPELGILILPVIETEAPQLLALETPFIYPTTKGVFSINKTLTKGSEREFEDFAYMYMYERWYIDNPKPDYLYLHAIIDLKNHDNYERQ